MLLMIVDNGLVARILAIPCNPTPPTGGSGWMTWELKRTSRKAERKKSIHPEQPPGVSRRVAGRV